MGDFKNLGLKKEIIEAVHRIQIRETTDVQDKIIPLSLQKKNIVFTSMTGSGKTLAFSIGFLGRINKKLDTQMLVIVPTRELCIQVANEIERLCKPLNLSVVKIFGGRDMDIDKNMLMKKKHIIVATPGRLIVYINEKKIKLGEVKLLVFDESDQMFDNGFYDDCAYIRSRVAMHSQIILSSATISDRVEEFIKNEIDDYELLKIGLNIPKNIVQERIDCKISAKNKLLLKILSQKKFDRVLIFTNKKPRTYSISDFLIKNKYNSKPINSDFEQSERENHLKLFKDGSVKILVATDVAARGLHIDNVDIVINYDVPNRAEFYVHRIGRTGRLDKEGYALTMVCPEDDDRFHHIEFDYNIKVDYLELNNNNNNNN
jgi:superfamily II DNA/RNA helicase